MVLSRLAPICFVLLLVSQAIEGQQCNECPAGPPGRQGKRGPKGDGGLPGLAGLNGAKGEPGLSCECPGHGAIEERLDELERVLPGIAGWQKYVHGSQVLWYKLFTDDSNYQSAKNKCLRMGARLAATGMRVPGIRNAIMRDIVRPSGRNIWIGLDDLKSQGRYVWADGEPSTRSNTDWGPSEPSSASERGGELHNNIGHKVNDYMCHYAINYLCEMEM